MSIALSIISILLTILFLCLLAYLKGKIDQAKIDHDLFIMLRNAILKLPIVRPILTDPLNYNTTEDYEPLLKNKLN